MKRIRIDAAILDQLFRDVVYVIRDDAGNKLQAVSYGAGLWIARDTRTGSVETFTDAQAIAYLNWVRGFDFSVTPWQCCGTGCQTPERQAMLRVVRGISHGICNACAEVSHQEIVAYAASLRETQLVSAI
jgi:hypothetical protein